MTELQRARRRVAELVTSRRRLENRREALRQAEDEAGLEAVEAELRALAPLEDSARRQAQQLEAVAEKRSGGA